MQLSFSSPLNRLRYFLRQCDVLTLRILHTTGKHHEKHTVSLGEVNAVSGPEMKTQLADIFANRLHISIVSTRSPLDSTVYASFRNTILQPAKPF